MLRLFISLLLALPLSAAETSWQVRTWVTDDGLPNNDVPCVTQSQDGAMLFATRGGLARFDGLRFREIKVKISRGGGVGAALAGKDGSLLVVTNGVVVQFNAARQEKVIEMPFLNVGGSRETAFFEDQDGTRWLCFEGGRFHRIRGDQMEQVPVQTGLSPIFASCAALDVSGQVWACGPRVLAKWLHDRFETVAELPKDRCMMTRAAAGGIWIGAGRMLLRHTAQGGLQSIAEIRELPQGARISFMHEDGAGRLWLGTFGNGLWLYDQGRLESVPLPNPDVWWLAEDREGSLWAATGGGGVCRVRPRLLAMLDAPGSPLSEVARAICTPAQGDFWVATQNARLFTRRAGEWHELAPGTGWPGRKAVRLASGIAGDVWIGTGDGNLVHWDGSRFESIALPDEQNMLSIVSLFQASNGDLWVGRGFNLWRRRNGQWSNVPLVAESGEAFTLAEDRQGRIWTGTMRGFLLREEGGRFVRIAADDFTCSSIRSLLVMPDGALLVATQGAGILRCHEGRCTALTPEQGLPHKTVSQLAMDDKGRIWAGSDAGLFMAPYEEIMAVASRSKATLHATLLGRSEGISGLQANASFPGALVERDGTFWCSTRSGLARIDTDRVGDNTVPPAASIEAMSVNDGAPIPLADAVMASSQTGLHPVMLQPGVRTLAFEFGASSFISPENVRLRYQLTGIDPAPRLADADRRAVYGHIPPGEYTLHLSAANNDGVWSTHDAVLSLHVSPYYYETAWFRALIVLAAVVFVIFVGYRIARARYRRRTEALRQEAAVHAERTRIARDMHDQVGASLTQISLLSDIALAQGSDIPQLNRLAETAREAVTALDEIVWAVDPAQDRFDSLLEYLAPQITELAQAAGLRCRLDFPAQTDPRHLTAAFRHQLFLIIREAVNNVVKHARATELRVRVGTTQALLTIEITDNGAGFDAAAVSGHGLSNMRSRTLELNGTFELTATQGTRICIAVPWPISSSHS